MNRKQYLVRPLLVAGLATVGIWSLIRESIAADNGRGRHK